MERSPDVGIDVGLLKDEIRKHHPPVLRRTGEGLHLPDRRAWAEDLGYRRGISARVPERSVESFAGVANPFSLGRLEPGERVFDLGCGAGTDSLVAALMVGSRARSRGST